MPDSRAPEPAPLFAPPMARLPQCDVLLMDEGLETPVVVKAIAVNTSTQRRREMMRPVMQAAPLSCRPPDVRVPSGAES